MQPITSAPSTQRFILLIAVGIAMLAGLPAHAQRPSRTIRPRETPFAAVLVPRDTIHWLTVAPFEFTVMLGPDDARISCGPSTITPIPDQPYMYAAVCSELEPGLNIVFGKSAYNGLVYTDERVIVVEKPVIRYSPGIDVWQAFNAYINEPYDPSSDIFANTNIPQSHYQTVVTIRGREVMNLPGLRFGNLSEPLRSAMMVTADMQPGDIVTRVYWRPGGTWDAAKWRLLMSTQADPAAVFPLQARTMRVARRFDPTVKSYGLPDHFALMFTEASPTWTSPALPVSAMLGETGDVKEVGVQCYDCDPLHVRVALDTLYGAWTFRLTAEHYPSILPAANDGNGRPVQLLMTVNGTKKQFTHTFTAMIFAAPACASGTADAGSPK